ncbi:MAG: hypothetical protein K6T83_22735, partial [Alicyclobacillus sp.]|nr:hypothetical protein [Alicyclobacillus sp.]
MRKQRPSKTAHAHRASRSLRMCIGWFMFAIMSGLCMPTVAQARTIGMTSVVGFSGYYSPTTWVPVDVTVDNPGPAVSADIWVNVDYPLPNNRIESGTLHWPVQLPKHGWTHVHIAVPGTIFNGASQPEVDCTVQGQVVARTYLSGNALGNISLIAVLSERPQDAQFLLGSTGPSGAPVLPVTVSASSLPSQANLYNNVTAVVATPSALANLRAHESDKNAALQTWVRLGGLLLVPGVAEAKTGWSLPLVPGAPHTLSGKKLQEFLGDVVAQLGKVHSSSIGLTHN